MRYKVIVVMHMYVRKLSWHNMSYLTPTIQFFVDLPVCSVIGGLGTAVEVVLALVCGRCVLLGAVDVDFDVPKFIGNIIIIFTFSK